jgi:hypothetical protein
MPFGCPFFLGREGLLRRVWLLLLLLAHPL